VANDAAVCPTTKSSLKLGFGRSVRRLGTVVVTFAGTLNRTSKNADH
jgi:hypothetical protein